MRCLIAIGRTYNNHPSAATLEYVYSSFERGIVTVSEVQARLYRAANPLRRSSVSHDKCYGTPLMGPFKC